jgi:hypothetical protein
MTMDLSKYLTVSHTPTIKWIGVEGYDKSGKTKALIELSRHIPTLYVDFEKGTGPYTGAEVLHVSPEGGGGTISVKDFVNDVATQFASNNKYRILVLDPFTTFANYVMDALMKKMNVNNLADYTEKGIGNGWNVYYDKMISFMTKCMASFDLVITVSHLKLSEHYVTDAKKISIADVDLVGQFKQYVKRTANANFIFTSKVIDGKYTTLINNDKDGDVIRTLLGSRDYPFIQRINNEEDFLRELCLMFDIEYKPSLSERKEVKFNQKEKK